MRGIGFFLGLIGNRLRRHTSSNTFPLNGDGGNCLFIPLAAVMEYDFPPYGVGDLTEINAIGISKGNGVLMGVLLQHNDTVFIEISTKSGFVTEKVFAGDSINGLIPVLQLDVIIIITFQPFDGIGLSGIIRFGFDVNYPGASIVKVSRILSPAFIFAQGYGFNPRKIIPPTACQSIDVVSFVAHNLGSLRIILIMFFPVIRNPFPAFAFFVGN